MEIKYFFIKVGKFEFFQPQNVKDLGRFRRFDTLTGLMIASANEPAWDNATLYLNGDQRAYSFKFLRSPIGAISKFLPIIKDYNKGITNV